jgi:uncharacterized Rossmann fold enzyme
MNLTTQTFLQHPPVGRGVFNDVPEPLLALQDEVRHAFGYAIESDVESAKQMELLFSEVRPFGREEWNTVKRQQATIELRKDLHAAKQLYVVGAGSESIRASDYGPEARFIAADGAVGAIDDLSKVLCVVSDGDGAEHLQRAIESSVHIVLHAHGDNLETWNRLCTKWSEMISVPPLTLTHQTKTSFTGMHNPGGFTDGDRALCFLQSIGLDLSHVQCLGFSTQKVGIWSGTTNPVAKLDKLQWMNEAMIRLGVEHQLINCD